LYLLGVLKKHLKGSHFSCEEVKAAMAKWFREQPEKFYTDGFEKLVQHWQHCIEREGDYVETWGIERKYTLGAVFYALFHFDTLSGCKHTNMEAVLLEHPVWMFHWHWSSTIRIVLLTFWQRKMTSRHALWFWENWTSPKVVGQECEK
jgi:hypothetical protein